MKTSTPLFLAVLLLTAVQGAAPQGRFEVGQPFPSILFPSLDDGRPSSIAQYRGQKLLLHIFASW